MRRRMFGAVLTLAILLGRQPATADSDVICTGDCNYDGMATVDELLTGVAIRLEQRGLDACSGFDLTDDGVLTVDELVGGVANALQGCPTARFEPAPCAVPLPAGQNPTDVTCGTVVVHENRLRPGPRTVRLAVATLHATGPAPLDDPLVNLGAGIGRVLDASLQLFTADFAAPLQSVRDLVFFDQRGTGRSRPALDCPETAPPRERFAVEQSIEADAADDVGALLACHARLLDDGVDLSAYDTAALAADVRDVMRALGYRRWHLYGYSQSTRIAQISMRDAPPGEIRSVVLDSPLPLSRVQFVDEAAKLEQSIAFMVEDCAADPACQSLFPALATDTFALIPRLNDAPLSVQPTDPSNGERFTAVFTGDRAVVAMRFVLSSAETIPFLPVLIWQMSRGDTSFLTVAAAALAQPPYSGDGLLWSLLCADQIPAITPEAIADAEQGVMHPEIARVARTFTIGHDLAVCGGWTGIERGAGTQAPVVSSLPTLILSGQYDPLTPPAYGREIGATLDHGAHLVFRGYGHGVLYSFASPTGPPGCAMTVVARFLSTPDETSQQSCVDALPPPRFFGT